VELGQFEALYRDSRAEVYAFVSGLLRDRSAAEEVTATAFEKALRARDRFDPARGSARGWMFGIARNAAYDELRRRTRQAELKEGPMTEDRVSPGPDELAESAARRDVVRSAMTDLDDRERELVVLKFHAGLSHDEIGEVMGISATNASTMLHRTVTKLRKACREMA
jgi:RNA polymerase sigma-70 factor, ECF subfamily